MKRGLKGVGDLFAEDDTCEALSRQVSFIIKERKLAPTHTDWMKARVDCDKGKRIYSHRMSVVDRLLLLHNLYFHYPWRSTGIRQHGQQQKSEPL